MREEDIVCVGSDGLQYCKVCGEAKEAFFPKGGFMGMKKHSRQCACDRKAYEAEQKYFKDKEHRELVSRNTSICFDESRMEEWTFAYDMPCAVVDGNVYRVISRWMGVELGNGTKGTSFGVLNGMIIL